MGHLNRHGFMRSVGILAGGSALGQGLAVLVLPLLTRLYTPEDFSVLAIFASMLGIIASIACLRYEIAIPIPPDDSEAMNLLGVALICATSMASLTLLTVLWLHSEIIGLFGHPGLGAVLWMLPIGVFVYGLYAVFQLWATRMKRFALVGRTRLTQALAAVTAQLGFGALGVTPAGLVVGQVVIGGAGFLRLGKEFIAHDKEVLRALGGRSMRAVASKYIRFPTYSVIEALANSAAMMAPIFIVAAAIPGGEAGQLSLASRVMLAPMTLIGAAVAQVFLSHAAEEYRKAQLGRFVRTTVVNMMRMALAPLFLAALLAPSLFPLIFGSEWARAGVLAAWLMPAVLLQLLASPVSMSLHVVSAQRIAMALQLFGLVLRVGGVSVAAVFAQDYISEVYAVTGFVFYLVYIAVIFRVTGERCMVGEKAADLYMGRE